MTILTVFYDGKCGLCHTCRRWLTTQPKFIELRFVPFQSEEALTLMPELMRFEPSKELVVLTQVGYSES